MAEFARFAPDTRLSDIIHGYWFLQTGMQPKKMELVPDGYPELLFVRRGKLWYCTRNSSEWHCFSTAGILGQLSGQFQLYIPPESEVLFVKFHSDGVIVNLSDNQRVSVYFSF